VCHEQVPGKESYVYIYARINIYMYICIYIYTYICSCPPGSETVERSGKNVFFSVVQGLVFHVQGMDERIGDGVVDVRMLGS